MSGKRKSILFIAVFITCFVSLLLPVYGQQRAADRPLHATHTQTFDAIHYKIEIDVRVPEATLIAKTTMSFLPLKDKLSFIELNATDMDIKKVYLSNGTSLTFEYKNPVLKVNLNREYNYGEKLEIVTEYKVVKPRAGFFFIDPEGTDPSKPTGVWTQGQTVDSRRWIPCFDWPNDRITSEVIATVPEKFTTVSNGLLLNERINGNGTKTVHWRQKMPHTTYLITFVAGEYFEYKDPYKWLDVRYYVFPWNKDYAEVTFGRTPEMVEFFENYFGYPYPWEKYYQIEVKDFTAGAMENTSATTFRDSYVHDERGHLDYSADGTVSHELAHMWFGDLVTCEDWGELWLNESFATYSSILWREHKDGIDDAMIDLYNNQNTYLAQARRTTHALKYMKYPNPDWMFDQHSYQKGSVVLHGLRNEVGDDLFKKSLAWYLKRNEYQSVETEHLRQAFEKVTGKDMRWWFDQWIHKPGHPVFLITDDYDEAGKEVVLNIKQIQDTKKDFPIYKITVPIEIIGGGEKKFQKIIVSKEEESFKIPFDSKPDLVRFDKGYTFLRVYHFQKTTEEFAYQMKHDSDVMGRLVAADSLAVRVDDKVAAKALLYALKSDKSGRIRSKAARSLRQFTLSDVKKGLTEALTDDFARVRRDASSSLANNKMDKNLAKKMQKLFKSDRSYFTQAAALDALAAFDAKKYTKEFKEGLKLDSRQEVIRIAALRGLVAAKDKNAPSMLMEYSSKKYKDDLRQTVCRMIGDLEKETPEITRHLSEILKETGGFTRFFAVIAFENLKSKEGLKVMEEAAADATGQFKGFLTFRINRLKNILENEESK